MPAATAPLAPAPRAAGLRVLLRTALALGVLNIWRVLAYRLGVKTGLNPVRALRAAVPAGPFFAPVPPASAPLPPPLREWWDELHYFGAHPLPLSATPPDWHANPLTGARVAGADRPWWQIPDFDPAVGDIKTVWEASRLDWVLAFAQRMRAGDDGARSRLEAWLADWLAHNPPYRGPNWKCGQEASIRVMHLAMAALLLGQARRSEAGLLDLVDLHLQRIAPTLGYAVAQDNNHGTSEAAALFIGGSWLAAQRPGSRGAGWALRGRRQLEERVARLVMPDGGFSQYSLNYHRVLLDTLSMAEAWRRALAMPAFSATFHARARTAAEWLRRLTRPGGDAPNLGANDGARLLPLAPVPQRDHRPAVQLATVLFAGQRAYAGAGDFNAPLAWLGIDLPEAVASPLGSAALDASGHAVLARGEVLALLRYPRFRFRPSQADALHLDLWRGDENLLRDAGTYSYHCAAEWLAYFPGTAAHNTVQFDGRDQMPRLGRFLFGDWLAPEVAPEWAPSSEIDRVQVAYRDRAGARHVRRVALSARHLKVVDEVEGFRERAVLRWRLAPGDWVLDGPVLRRGTLTLSVAASVPIARLALVSGQESRHYLQRTPLPVLEVEVRQPGSLTTVMEWPL